MFRSTILISKDVLRADYLGCYGSRGIPTPNIDELAARGTRFTRYYTAAPSSGMSYTAMFSGLDIHQINRGYFGNVGQFDQSVTLFQELEQRGCATHVIWDKKWYASSRRKAMVFDEKTKFHNLDIAQHVGPHGTYERDASGQIIPRDGVDCVAAVIETIEVIQKDNGPVFIWLHCPHCFAGYTGYGSDIGLFDELVGRIVACFQGDVLLTADHGHMNGEKGVYCYGFHVYEGSVRIPLITPNWFGRAVIGTPYSNVQVKNLILERSLRKQPFIYSDSQYYLQLDRNLMIMKGDYKYIFAKRTKTEELYDVALDPEEKVNLLRDVYVDGRRGSRYFVDEVYYYPKWTDAKAAYQELRAEKDRIWRTGTKLGDLAYLARNARRNGLGPLLRYLRPVSHTRGRWNSAILAAN